MTTIYLIRHAQAEGNLYRRCQAWYDGAITPMGYRQIAALEDRFRDVHFDAVYSSDLFRAMTTAKAICRPHDLPLQTDPMLREIKSGPWEDRPWGELIRTDREKLLAFWRCDPAFALDDSETFPAIQQRSDKAVRRIAAAHPDQTIAIVSHGCILRSSLALWLGYPAEQICQILHGDNTSVAKVEYDGNKMHVCWYNDVSHLSDELAHAPHPSAQTDAETASRIESSSLYFLPMDLPDAQNTYLEARRNAWITSHGSMDGFDGENFLCAAMKSYSDSPNSILAAMLNGNPAGILQMDFANTAEPNVGRVPFVYLNPEFRHQGLGAQLIGQAVSAYRDLGRQYLRLRCAPANHSAQAFYRRQGFYKVGQEPGGTGVLDTLEKYIGYDHP